MKNQYITNEKGKKIGVILQIKDFNKMMEKVEELEDIKAYDEAIRNNEESIPADQAFQEIEKKHHEIRG